VHKLYSCNVC